MVPRLRPLTEALSRTVHVSAFCCKFRRPRLIPAPIDATQRGGAIDNTSSGTIKFLRNAIARFRGNRTYDSGSGGGQVKGYHLFS